MQVNLPGFENMGVLAETGQKMFGASSTFEESEELKRLRTKIKYGLVHGKGIRKKKPRKKRKKTYGKNK